MPSHEFERQIPIDPGREAARARDMRLAAAGKWLIAVACVAALYDSQPLLGGGLAILFGSLAIVELARSHAIRSDIDWRISQIAHVLRHLPDHAGEAFANPARLEGVAGPDHAIVVCADAGLVAVVQQGRASVVDARDVEAVYHAGLSLFGPGVLAHGLPVPGSARQRRRVDNALETAALNARQKHTPQPATGGDVVDLASYR